MTDVSMDSRIIRGGFYFVYHHRIRHRLYLLRPELRLSAGCDVLFIFFFFIIKIRELIRNAELI